MLFCLAVYGFVKSALTVSSCCVLQRHGCRSEAGRALSGDSFLLNDNTIGRDNVGG